MDLELREMRREDFDLVRDLYRATKQRLRPENYDRWRFFDTPWGDSPAMIAVAENMCAALYVIWPVMLKLGRERVPGAQSMDTMTHPDHRGGGLFVTLAERCFDLARSRGVEVVYGFPNESSYPGFVRRLNFDHAGDVHAWDAPRDARSWRRGRQSVDPGVSVERDLDAEALQPLLASLPEDKNACRVERSATWLAWRYGPASAERYEWVLVREGQDVVAATLLGERDESWGDYERGAVRIHELIAADEEALRRAAAAAVHRCRERGAKSLRILAHGEDLTKALTAEGFRQRERHPFIARKLVGRRLDGNVHNFQAWRIVGGDMDSF